MPNYSKIKGEALAGVFFLLWLGIHFFPGKISMFNYSDWGEFSIREIPAHKYLQSVVDYHSNFPAFARRWFTNFWFSLFPKSSIGTVFILSEWLAMVALGFLWLKRNGQNQLLPILLFFFSFPVWFAWFPSQYTFEEPFLWLFLFGFSSTLHQSTPLSMVFALGAILTRETALLFLLPWLWVEKKLTLPWILIICSGFVPFFYLSQNIHQEFQARWDLLLSYNFQNKTFAIESLLYFFFTFFPTIFFLQGQNKKDRKVFIGLLILNTLLVFFGAKARESRLHLLPLFYLLLRWKPAPLPKWTAKAGIAALGSIIISAIFFYSGFWAPSGARVETVWVREYGILWGGVFGLTAGMLIFGKSTDQK